MAITCSNVNDNKANVDGREAEVTSALLLSQQTGLSK